MGTNYYLKAPSCSHCGAARTLLHIGKSSAGWNFALRIYPEPVDLLSRFGVEKIQELDDWRPLFQRFEILDEYHRKIEPAEMISIIAGRSYPHLKSRLGVSDHFRPGELFGGKGTYDLCNYDFS